MSYYYSLYHIPVFPLVKSLWLCVFCHPIFLDYKHVLRRPLLISRTAIMGKAPLVFISQTQNQEPMDFATFFQACRSIPPDHPGFLSVDKHTHVSYTSSRNPAHHDIYSVVRQACVRRYIVFYMHRYIVFYMHKHWILELYSAI